MRAFSNMIAAMDQTTKTNLKVNTLASYLEQVNPEERMWAIALVSGRRPKRLVKTSLLREWAAEQSGIPDWLFEETYHTVGDLAETMALVMPDQITDNEDVDLSTRMQQLMDLQSADEQNKKDWVLQAWSELNGSERFVFNKLLTGGFRIGVSQKLLARALSKAFDIEENILAHRLMGYWSPVDTKFSDLILAENVGDDLSKPYPFFLAYALDQEPEALGDTNEWIAERKWDGIRGQIIKRNGEFYVWSRGEELVTDKFPEYERIAQYLPDGTVLDGEILCMKEGVPLPFALLQKRIGRKRLSAKILNEAPVGFYAYDILEFEAQDIRHKPILERREILENVLSGDDQPKELMLSQSISFISWDELRGIRNESRKHLCEGLMLKHKYSPYEIGRKKGGWWKWKVDPMTIDAVLIYAMRGHGRRANLYTDYTFAVWNEEGDLVPFTKAYSGLTDEEFRQVDRFVKKNTLDRFGPVRSVNAELVFEIAFEGIQRSSRHKSGIALRFPRMRRWRRDKPASEANTLNDLLALLEEYES